MRALRRGSATLLSVLIVLGVVLGGTVAGAAPAQALTWYGTMCSGFAACDAAGRTNAGYDRVYTQSFWFMYGGHNCTNYASYRLQQRGIADFITTGHGNATDWGSQAKAKGIAVDRTAPLPGDIAWWNSTAIAPLGHVAYVESVDAAAGTIVVSEDNSSSTFDWRTYRSTEVSGFIHTGRAGIFSDGRYIAYAGASYVIAGGAPIAISSWTPFGGVQPTTTVTATQFAGLRALPADGTVVKSKQTGQLFVIAGGAPLPAGSVATLGGIRTPVAVDQAAIDRAGGTGAWAHLSKVPANGTHLTDQNGSSYAVAGGAPLGIVSLADVGASTTTRVDSATIAHAGGGTAPWNHLRAWPTNGTYIATPSALVYRVVGGAAVRLTPWSAVGGPQPFTRVSTATVTNAGGVGKWRFVRATPTDGAAIRTVPSNALFVATGGYWYRATAATSPIVLGDAAPLPSQVRAASPTVTGMAAVGSVLTVHDSVWAPLPVALTHQWYRSGQPISGATASTYALTAADAGKAVTERTTGARTGLKSATSPASNVITVP